MSGRYKITCHCKRCGMRWHRITKHPESADPPCPNLDCGEAVTPIGMDLSLNKAPAAIGGNIQHKAIDETAKIVMEDYGLTDLKSDVRPHEDMAPKLPPRQQQMADGFFGAGRKRQINGFNPGAHARAAMAGALSDPVSTQRSIGATHAARVRPPVHLVGSDARR